MLCTLKYTVDNTKGIMLKEEPKPQHMHAKTLKYSPAVEVTFPRTLFRTLEGEKPSDSAIRLSLRQSKHSPVRANNISKDIEALPNPLYRTLAR